MCCMEVATMLCCGRDQEMVFKKRRPVVLTEQLKGESTADYILPMEHKVGPSICSQQQRGSDSLEEPKSAKAVLYITLAKRT
jgi:hypothetical protein